MAKEKLPTIFVQWEGNRSKHFMTTPWRKSGYLYNVVAINKTAVVQPSLAKLHDGDNIEYEFVAKKGKLQLWRGIVISIDPDVERRAGLGSKKGATTTKEANRLSATNPDAESHASSDSKGAERTTKGASHLSATDPDMERRTTNSLFEDLGSNKGKKQK